MDRKIRNRALTDAGDLAGFNGEPCEAPTARELDRAAWEVGWREGRKRRDALPCAVCGAAGGVEPFQGLLEAWDASGWRKRSKANPFAHAACIEREKRLRDAALACGRSMVAYLRSRVDGRGAFLTGRYFYDSLDAALRDIAIGEIYFGDVCDDNLFIHEVLSQAGLVSGDVSVTVNSDAETATWNAVVNRLDWAAAEIRKELARAK